VADFWSQSYFFFEAPETFDLDIARKKWTAATPQLLQDFAMKSVDIVHDFSAPAVKAFAEEFCSEKGVGLGQLMNPLRLCLVGGSFGPDLALICEMLGRDEVVRRIGRALETISKEITLS
jgi:glutamyl-tRNA synthetase